MAEPSWLSGNSQSAGNEIFSVDDDDVDDHVGISPVWESDLSDELEAWAKLVEVEK